MKSKAATANDYLRDLPADRRHAIADVRKVILANLPTGYQETMQYGMINYAVPHSLYPAGYHCDPSQPLMYTALASQKNYMAIYLMSVYGHKETEAWFRKAFTASGKNWTWGSAAFGLNAWINSRSMSSAR